MKIAIISDIHGNASALSAVLSDIKKNKVDSIICLGDVATLGPSPREVLDMIKDLNCPCIIGNHEEALFHPNRISDFDIKGELLEKTIYWCLDKLNQEDMKFLNTFIPSISFKLEINKEMLCYHGSPDSSIWSVNSNSSNEELDKVFRKYKSISVAVGGHTHIQMVKKHWDLLIVNPWSVWCAFTSEPNKNSAPLISQFAEYAIIESNKEDISVTLKKIDFNISEFILTLQNSDLPLKEWWLEEYKRLGY